MKNKYFEYKGFMVMLKYDGTPNISIWENKKDFNITFPDFFDFARTKNLEKEAKKIIDDHLEEL